MRRAHGAALGARLGPLRRRAAASRRHGRHTRAAWPAHGEGAPGRSTQDGAQALRGPLRCFGATSPQRGAEPASRVELSACKRDCSRCRSLSVDASSTPACSMRGRVPQCKRSLSLHTRTHTHTHTRPHPARWMAKEEGEWQQGASPRKHNRQLAPSPLRNLRRTPAIIIFLCANRVYHAPVPKERRARPAQTEKHQVVAVVCAPTPRSAPRRTSEDSTPPPTRHRNGHLSSAASNEQS